jgi:hypothetical protein
VRLELVCLRHSILLCNVAFFYSFSSFPTLLKTTKKSNITQKEEGKRIFFLFGSTMSHPWTKHILLFVRQALGFNMTLGGCSHYIELCPPPFGYYSKHMESLCCLLHRELMSNAMLPESHHLSCYFPSEVIPSLSRPLCSLFLSLMPDHPQSPIKSLFKINEAFSLIIKILYSTTNEPSKTSV